MKDRSRSIWAPAVLVALALAVPGCNSEDLSGVSDPQVQAAVRESAPVALTALSMADGAYPLIAALLGEIGTGTTLASAPPVLAALPVLACDASFDLGNGVTGECALADKIVDPEDEIDTATLSFFGNLEVDGLVTAINSSADRGTLVLTLPKEQPATGTRCVVDFSALATNTRWTASWLFAETADVEDIASLAEIPPTLNAIVTPAGGSATTVTITLAPATRTASLQASSGRNVSWVVDNAAWTGYVVVNGDRAGTVAIEGDCVAVDYVSASLTDETLCRD